MVYPIIIVEDDKKIANIIKVYLESNGFRVVHFERGSDAIDFALKEIPLLVILDLKLPDISGETVCQELKGIGDFPIIMLTAKSQEEERIAGFALGADDYVIKPFSPKELVYRVKAVLKRAKKDDLYATHPLSFNDRLLTIDGRSYEVKKREKSVDLTPTEFKVLFTLASFPQKVFTREELVEKALGYQFEGYERSIDAHIKNIRRKVEDDPKNPAFILRELMIRDFRYYLEGEMEDKVYRVIANIEGAYEKYSGWKEDVLTEDAIWALMLGLEIKIKDLDGKVIIDAEKALNKLSPLMRRRIRAIAETELLGQKGDFSPYPLFLSGKEIGSLEVRFMRHEKEFVFIERSNKFLLLSLFAVGGAVILFSIVFSRKLTNPIKKLDSAAEAISVGDLKRRLEIPGSDEISRLSETFNRMAENLEKQESLRKKLISNVAHELRTPITAI